jgi:hypothetical protein
MTAAIACKGCGKPATDWVTVDDWARDPYCLACVNGGPQGPKGAFRSYPIRYDPQPLRTGTPPPSAGGPIPAAPTYYSDAEAAAMADTILGEQRPGENYVMLNTIERTHVAWLWPSRIPLGKVAILEGDPDHGKSTISLDLLARVSTGTPMPNETARRDPAGGVIVCAEDDLGDTVLPRLEAHQADLTKIATIPLERDEHGKVKPLVLPDDLDRLELAIKGAAAKLLVIDPITAYLSETISTNNDASVRRATTPLADLAQRTGCAIVLIRHLNKAGDLKTKYRGGGSIAFTGAARSVLVVEEHPEQPGLRVLARVKGNLAKAVPALGYRITEEPLYGCPLIVWQGTVHIDADTLLRGHDSRRDAEVREEAMELLRDLLADGPVPAADAKKALTGAGISASTIQRAKKQLKVVSLQERDEETGKLLGWRWALPRHEGQEADEDQDQDDGEPDAHV